MYHFLYLIEIITVKMLSTKKIEFCLTPTDPLRGKSQNFTEKN